jgi:hypothetical protein
MDASALGEISRTQPAIAVRPCSPATTVPVHNIEARCQNETTKLRLPRKSWRDSLVLPELHHIPPRDTYTLNGTPTS